MARQITRPNERTRLRMEFFQNNPAIVARDLVGRTLVKRAPNLEEKMGIIREVAAWQGAEDSSSKTIRYHPGIVGVSKKFGHFLLDIGTGYQSRPSCITIMGLYTPEGLIDGPGKVTKYLGVDSDYDSMSIDTAALWIGGEGIDPEKILQRVKQAPANSRGRFYFND